MKLQLTVLLICVSISAKAQYADSAQLAKSRIAMCEAGLELERYTRTTNLGTMLTFAGAGMAAVNIVASSNGKTNPRANSFVTATGVVVAVAGIITTLTAHAHVGKAGRYLKQGGIMVIPIEGKKKK